MADDLAVAPILKGDVGPRGLLLTNAVPVQNPNGAFVKPHDPLPGHGALPRPAERGGPGRGHRRRRRRRRRVAPRARQPHRARHLQQTIPDGGIGQHPSRSAATGPPRPQTFTLQFAATGSPVTLRTRGSTSSLSARSRTHRRPNRSVQGGPDAATTVARRHVRVLPMPSPARTATVGALTTNARQHHRNRRLLGTSVLVAARVALSAPGDGGKIDGCYSTTSNGTLSVIGGKKTACDPHRDTAQLNMQGPHQTTRRGRLTSDQQPAELRVFQRLSRSQGRRTLLPLAKGRRGRLPAGRRAVHGRLHRPGAGAAVPAERRRHLGSQHRRPRQRRVARVLGRQPRRPGTGRRELGELHAGHVRRGRDPEPLRPDADGPGLRARPGRHAQPEHLYGARHRRPVRVGAWQQQDVQRFPARFVVVAENATGVRRRPIACASRTSRSAARPRSSSSVRR